MAGADGLAVALLAAGRSQRFGAQDKLGALLHGKPLLHWAAETGRAINAAQHFVVTAPDFPQQNLPAGYHHLVNDVSEEGLASSLRIAASHARTTGASALLILLGDMPLITADHLNALLAEGGRATFSRAPGGSPQPPALLPAMLFPAIEALSGDSGARAFAADAVLVEAPADLLIDVDTPEDLERCARLLAR